MLLTVVGRRTGAERTVPLVYVRDGDDVVIAAAFSGADEDPAWWLNLQANPDAVVTEGDRRFDVRASEVTDDDERARLWLRLVEMYPPFAEYQTRTTRVIPVARLHPR